MKILILGDIMGSSGRNVLSKKLPGIIIKYKVILGYNRIEE